MDCSGTSLYIAQRIRGLCSNRGISLRELSDKSGLSSSALYRILNGRCGNPGVDTLIRICQALAVSLGDFWSGQDEGSAG